jgi:hypothetical protein
MKKNHSTRPDAAIEEFDAVVGNAVASEVGGRDDSSKTVDDCDSDL